MRVDKDEFGGEAVRARSPGQGGRHVVEGIRSEGHVQLIEFDNL